MHENQIVDRRQPHPGFVSIVLAFEFPGLDKQIEDELRQVSPFAPGQVRPRPGLVHPCAEFGFQFGDWLARRSASEYSRSVNAVPGTLAPKQSFRLANQTPSESPPCRSRRDLPAKQSAPTSRRRRKRASRRSRPSRSPCGRRVKAKNPSNERRDRTRLHSEHGTLRIEYALIDQSKLNSGGQMSLGTILLIILVLLLIGALPSWPYSAQWGPYPAGGLGIVLVVVLILVLLGRV